MSASAVEPSVDPQLDQVAVENARLVRAARAELLEHSPSVTVEMLARARSATNGATHQWIRRHRTAGRIVTVEHQGRTLLPSFQFDEVFDLDPTVADIVTQLTGYGMDGWAIWHWFHTVNTWIERRPVDAAAVGDTAALARAADGLTAA